MKNKFRIVALMTVLNASSAFAASGAESGGFSLIGWLFVGFLAVIVTLQLVPALIMFGSMMVGIFGKAENQEKSTALD